MENVIYKNAFFAEIDAEQKANHPGIPDSDTAIGYHNGLTMAKAIAMKLAVPAPEPAPHARWEFGELDALGSRVRCSCCGWGAENVDPALWLAHPGHKYCGACGARMDLEAKDDFIKQDKE